MASEVVYERRRKPFDFRILTGVAGIATMAVSGAALLGSSPELGTVSAIVGGVLTMIFGLLVSERSGFGGRLQRLHRQLTLERPATAEGYRDAPRGPELVWGDTRVPLRRAREVVVGHFANHTGGGASHHFWPLFLVMDDRVVELDVFRTNEQARLAQAALAERLELPTADTGKGRFGEASEMGCLVSALTITGQLATVLFGSMGAIFVGRGSLHALLPALMVLVLWTFTGITSRIGRKKVRPAIDEEVVETFDLTGPKVRVEPELGEADEVPAEATRPGREKTRAR